MRWLLLRGLGREIGHWGRFRQCLEQLGEQLEFLDLPGAGTERARKVPLSIRQMVEDLRARRGANEPTGLIAVSLGGMIALDWPVRYPAEILRLVIINSSTSSVAWPWERLSPASLATSLCFLLTREDERKETMTLRLTTNLRARALEARAREWAQVRHMRPVRAASVFRQLIAAARFRLESLPSCPILVVRSLGDRLVDPICSERLAKRLGAELLTHPSGGHDLSTDEPDWLAEKIVSWGAAR